MPLLSPLTTCLNLQQPVPPRRQTSDCTMLSTATRSRALQRSVRRVLRSPRRCLSEVAGADDEGEATKQPARKKPFELPVTYEDVSRAYYRIRSGIVRSTTSYSETLSALCDCDVYLKRDFEQASGSFKERGARNALMLLSEEKKSKGVVAASAGNHALALAYHGAKLGVPVTVVMPVTAPMTKVERSRKYGAEVLLKGAHIGEAKEFAMETFPDRSYINGYDDPEIIAGAGSLAIEVLEEVPDMDVIVVPVGGAGLIAGVSLATKTLKPDAQVIGVEPDNVASYSAAVKAGKPVHEFIAGTLADGLAVPMVGQTAFEVARHYVDSTVCVNEALVSIAVLRLLEEEKIVVEGGGATSLAAMLPGGPLHGTMAGKKVVLPLCGGNIDTTVLGRIIDRGLAADMRMIRFTATVSDRPGGIAVLSRLLADLGVSIKDIYHERAWLHSRVDQVQVKCVVETTGKEHSDKVMDTLLENGYEVQTW